MSSNLTWIRSSTARALIWAALLMALTLGGAVLAVRQPVPATPDAHAAPMTDGQAVAQVVDSAKQIVDVAHLQQASGGYSFVSCTNESDPPYQVALYMSFQLPQVNPAGYLYDVTAAMVAAGWTRASTAGENFGQKLTRAGVTSTFYRTLSEPDFATMRLYGQCRATADHRNDNPVWTEVGL
jgi:hypothetical protein